MIEAYSFLAVFIAQIAAFSILFPHWFIGRVRRAAVEFPTERFMQLYPGVEPSRILERYIARYRIWNGINVAVGSLLLGWFAIYVHRPDWDDGPIEALNAAYFFLQMSPVLFSAFLEFRFSEMLGRLLDGKRTASLKRRGLFDFVSPYAVLLAILCYVAYVAYVLYIARNPFPGFAGSFVNIAMMTLQYAGLSFAVYWLMFRRRVLPQETPTARERAIGMGVRLCVYLSIISVLGLMLNFTLILWDLQRWEPTAGSAGFLLIAFFLSRVFATPPGPSGTGGLRSSAV